MVKIETIVIKYLLTQSSCMDNPTVRWLCVLHIFVHLCS